MSDGIRSGVNWMRWNAAACARPAAARPAACHQCLGRARYAFDQHVATNQQGRQKVPERLVGIDEHALGAFESGGVEFARSHEAASASSARPTAATSSDSERATLIASRRRRDASRAARRASHAQARACSGAPTGRVRRRTGRRADTGLPASGRARTWCGAWRRRSSREGRTQSATGQEQVCERQHPRHDCRPAWGRLE